MRDERVVAISVRGGLVGCWELGVGDGFGGMYLSRWAFCGWILWMTWLAMGACFFEEKWEERCRVQG